MTDNLFTNQNDQNQIDPNVDPLEVLTGPGGKFDKSKYADEAEMYKAIAKAKIESDNYVKHLEKGRDELREDYLKLREDYNSGPKVQELLDQFKNLQTNTNSSNNQNANDVNKPQFDPKDLDSLVDSKFREREMKKKHEENFNTSVKKLRETYGTNYPQVLKQKVEELGLSTEWANEAAATNPIVLFRTLGLDQQNQESFQAPPQNNTRRETFSPQGQTRNWAYYEKMRKEQPDNYWNPKTQVQLHTDSMRPGFEDATWKGY